MHKLIALYHPPLDPKQFRDHLLNVHLPIVERFPGLLAMRVGFDVSGPDGQSPYFAVVECDFENDITLKAALSSPASEEAAADVPNYALAGVTIITFPVQEVMK